jgi:SET domain-containing protein
MYEDVKNDYTCVRFSEFVESIQRLHLKSLNMTASCFIGFQMANDRCQISFTAQGNSLFKSLLSDTRSAFYKIPLFLKSNILAAGNLNLLPLCELNAVIFF